MLILLDSISNIFKHSDTSRKKSILAYDTVSLFY